MINLEETDLSPLVRKMEGFEQDVLQGAGPDAINEGLDRLEGLPRTFLSTIVVEVDGREVHRGTGNVNLPPGARYELFIDTAGAEIYTRGLYSGGGGRHWSREPIGINPQRTSGRGFMTTRTTPRGTPYRHPDGEMDELVAIVQKSLGVNLVERARVWAAKRLK